MAVKHYIPQEFVSEYILPAEKLAKKYGKSLSTIYKWKRAVKEGKQEKIQRSFQIDGRILGILWAIGRDDGKRFVLRSSLKSILEEVRDFFRLDAEIIEGRSMTKTQYKLYITGDAREALFERLHSLGWTERNAEVRRYPKGSIDHQGFIRAYVQLHSSLDFPKGRPRLRIYGNKVFIHELNEIASRVFSVRIKTPQAVNSKTYCLYYQRKKEIAELLPGNSFAKMFLRDDMKFL